MREKSQNKMTRAEDEETTEKKNQNKETALNLPPGSYLKFSNCNNDQFNDLNYWKLPLPNDISSADFEDYEYEDAKDYTNDDNEDNYSYDRKIKSESNFKLTSRIVNWE
jgi:hypothetical protein